MRSDDRTLDATDFVGLAAKLQNRGRSGENGALREGVQCLCDEEDAGFDATVRLEL
jgi:hypothetical protein